MMERGVVLDCARKVYSSDFIFRLLDVMALTHFTHLQLHFSDNEGYRIESDVCPELVSTDHFTKAEILEFQRYAKQKQITIIPELDSPGHLQHFLRVYPQFRLDESIKCAADITDPRFVAHIKSLITEVLTLFSDSPVFHLGCDEVIDWDRVAYLPSRVQTCLSATNQVDYINDLAEFVEQKGKRARIWNDGCYRKKTENRLKSSIEIAYWTRWHKEMAPVDTFLEHHHPLFNYNDNDLYFVLGEAAGYTYPSVEKLREFTLAKFAQQQWDMTHRSKGFYFSIWGDHPEALDEDMILTKITPLLTELATK